MGKLRLLNSILLLLPTSTNYLSEFIIIIIITGVDFRTTFWWFESFINYGWSDQLFGDLWEKFVSFRNLSISHNGTSLKFLVFLLFRPMICCHAMNSRQTGTSIVSYFTKQSRDYLMIALLKTKAHLSRKCCFPWAQKSFSNGQSWSYLKHKTF